MSRQNQKLACCRLEKTVLVSSSVTKHLLPPVFDHFIEPVHYMDGLYKDCLPDTDLDIRDTN